MRSLAAGVVSTCLLLLTIDLVAYDLTPADGEVVLGAFGLIGGLGLVLEKILRPRDDDE